MSRARDLADLADNSISGELDVGSLNIGGTEVIDSSRNLSNVGGLKTINSTSILGSGDISAGASTTYNDVGTYVFARSGSRMYQNNTISGSSLNPCGVYNLGGTIYRTNYSGSCSGTWRSMGSNYGNSSDGSDYLTLFVRIS